MTVALSVVLENKRGWREYGEAADDRRKRGVRSGRRTRVDLGVVGGYGGLKLGLGLGLVWGAIGL